jgi:hypothetical protein
LRFSGKSTIQKGLISLEELREMQDSKKTKGQLLEELTELHQRLVKLEAAEVERQQVEEGLKQSEERYRQREIL